MKQSKHLEFVTAIIDQLNPLLKGLVDVEPIATGHDLLGHDLVYHHVGGKGAIKVSFESPADIGVVFISVVDTQRGSEKCSGHIQVTAGDVLDIKALQELVDDWYFGPLPDDDDSDWSVEQALQVWCRSYGTDRRPFERAGEKGSLVRRITNKVKQATVSIRPVLVELTGKAPTFTYAAICNEGLKAFTADGTEAIVVKLVIDFDTGDVRTYYLRQDANDLESCLASVVVGAKHRESEVLPRLKSAAKPVRRRQVELANA